MAKRRRTSFGVWLGRAGLTIMAGGLLLYPVDWAVWEVRHAGGGGMGTVLITTQTAATLKGNRFEVYEPETTTVACSRSFLPEAGAGACWWLRHHAQVLSQY